MKISWILWESFKPGNSARASTWATIWTWSELLEIFFKKPGHFSKGKKLEMSRPIWTSYFENPFWHEIFDRFWKTFFKSDSKLSGKTISDGLGATRRLYTAFLEVSRFLNENLQGCWYLRPAWNCSSCIMLADIIHKTLSGGGVQSASGQRG